MAKTLGTRQTIDNFSTGVYEHFARQSVYVESVNKYYQLDKDATIPPQTHVVTSDPRLSHLDRLMGSPARYKSWAMIREPQGFNEQRKTPFSMARVAPALGSADAQDARLARVQGVPTKTRQEKHESATITTAFERIENLNMMLDFTIGRIGQFLQG
jgi:hypothetical protein